MLPLSNQVYAIFRGGWVLLRSIAVISSSVATIISSLLPLFLYSSISSDRLWLLFVFLTIAAFAIHGVLTHAFNDYTDHCSGTDSFSPAILSGGSRVIQNGMFSLHAVRKLAFTFTFILLILALVLAIFAQYKLVILLLIGIWSAVSYSVSPLHLSYRPFLGEWASLFPAIFSLGLAGPWLMLNTIPLWAIQNSLINALFCMAWVMVHHIPDLQADRRALPKKQTSVVWFVERFGLYYARFPALLYFFAAALCMLWLGFDRIWAAGFLLIMLTIAIILVLKMDVTNHEQVSNYEKILLFLAMLTAVGLGILV